MGKKSKGKKSGNGGGASELTLRAHFDPDGARALVVDALDSHVFVADAAAQLGVSKPTLARVVKLLGLEEHLPRAGKGPGRPPGLPNRETVENDEHFRAQEKTKEKV